MSMSPEQREKMVEVIAESGKAHTSQTETRYSTERRDNSGAQMVEVRCRCGAWVIRREFEKHRAEAAVDALGIERAGSFERHYGVHSVDADCSAEGCVPVFCVGVLGDTDGSTG